MTPSTYPKMPTTDLVSNAITPNIAILNQGVALLESLDDESYRRQLSVVFNGSIGGHMRHVIEHYQCLLSHFGESSAGVNYEARPRQKILETDRLSAVATLDAILMSLGLLEIRAPDSPVSYCAESSGSTPVPSSLVRELEFLLSHSVHHYALIAVLCRLQGFEPPTNFGMAPSTLRYLERIEQCAP